MLSNQMPCRMCRCLSQRLFAKVAPKISYVPHLPCTLSCTLSCTTLENHAARCLGRKDAAAMSRCLSRMFE